MLIMFVAGGDGQFYNTGQAPFSIKWMQIKTENFQVIYPQGFYQEANRVAVTLEYMYEYTSADLEHRPRKISILLHNDNVRSNGYVVWAPKRSEWVTTPPEESYAQDWLEQLALHEFRHVVQIDKLNQGFTQVLYLLFGEMAVGAVTGYLPLWFLEGDATVNETAFSASGRGRQPDFSKHLRAIELGMEERYSYDQSFLGSYKDYIPNHYVYGYQMTAYGRLVYGPELWSNTLDRVASHPHTLVPFYTGLKRSGAGSKVKLYHATFDSLKSYWKEQAVSYPLLKSEPVPVPETKHYKGYLYPQFTRQGMVAVRTGIDDITRFVLLKDSSETILHTPGRYYNQRIEAGNRWLIWTENIPHPRWEQQNWSVIKKMDMSTGRTQQLTHKSRYFSPALNHDESRILCVHIDKLNHYSIHILDAKDGRTINVLPAPEGESVFHPRWLNESEIVYISLGKKGKSIVRLNTVSGEGKTLLHAGYKNITSLSVGGDTLFFAWDVGMARNIYMLTLSGNEVSRVSGEAFEGDFPDFHPESRRLLFSSYTPQGFRPVSLSAEKFVADTAPPKYYDHAWANALSEEVKLNLQDSILPETSYDSLRYRRFLHTVNIHSWTPFYFDPTDFSAYDLQIYPGVSLLMQNKLSTVTAGLGYYYANETNHLVPSLVWEGLPPVFEVRAQFRDAAAAIRTSRDIPAPQPLQNYHSFEVRTYLPLDLTRNRYNRYIQPGLGYIYEHAYYIVDSAYQIGRDYLQLSFFGSNQLKRSARDLNTRFGQTLYLSHRFSLGDPQSFGAVTVANFNLYIPGLMRHHSLRLNAAWEDQQATAYNPSPAIGLPRGYALLPGMSYTSILRGSGEYYFPMFYPDWSAGPVVYFKRFHASIFLDYAQVSFMDSFPGELQSANYMSFGASVAAQVHFLRFFVPFTPKITGAFIPSTGDYEILLGVTVDASVF